LKNDGAAHRGRSHAGVPQDGPGPENWLHRLSRIGARHGLFDRIGPRHAGLFIDRASDTLLVAFDRTDSAWAGRSDGLPAGFEMVGHGAWSLLSVLAHGETWFRGAELERFFGALQSSGLLARYRSVLFFGMGADCGFAASVFSRFAPGAQVLAAGPVATLDPAAAPFERRFRAARRLSFRGPFGNGAQALAAAGPSVVLYDPLDMGQAAQAALFTGGNVLRIGLPYAGRDFHAILQEGGAMVPLLEVLARGAPSAQEVRRVLKQPCRENAGTMLRRARAALVRDQPRRAACLARQGFSATSDPRLGALMSEAEIAEARTPREDDPA
jgi:hypothetical protein